MTLREAQAPCLGSPPSPSGIMRKPKRPHRNPAPGEHRIMITNTMASTTKTNTIYVFMVRVKTTTMAVKMQLT